MEKKPLSGKRSQNAWEAFVLLWRGFGLVFRSSPFLTPIIILIGLVLALEPVVCLWIMKLIVDKLSKLAFSGGPVIAHLFFKGFELVNVTGLLAIQFGIWILARGLRSIEEYLSSKAQYNFELFMQTRIMRKCAELDLAFFEDSKNLDQLEKAMRGSSMSAWNLLWMLFSMIGSILTMGSYLFVLYMLHWLAPIVVALTTAPQMIASAHFSREHWKIYSEGSGDSRLRYYLSWLMTDKDSAKELKLFNLSNYMIERYRFYCKKFYEMELKTTKRSVQINFWLGAFSNVGTIGLWFYTLLKATAGLISAGDAYLYLSSTESARHNLLSLFSRGGRLFEHMLFLSDLFELLDRKPETVKGSLTGMTGPGGPRWGRFKAPATLTHGIEFRNVSFSYSNSDRPALENVSFTLAPGESTALVGKNGAGKTTIVKLLVRLYDPTDGAIYIDGRNIKEYDLDSLRNMFSVVFQDYVRYYLTLRENIGFGDVERINDTAQIAWATDRAGATELVEKLPAGYETYLVRQYGLVGEDISGGEWQKVALARSFMRDPPVTILDEPTASLDAFAEMDLYKMFEELTAGKLSVIISHRFSTVRVASRIIVLDEGKVIESGTHQELMLSEGLYSQMYNTQAERYK